MKKFLIKVMQEEWVVKLCEVDQYGQEHRPYWTSDPFPTYQDAVDYLPRVAVPHEYVKGRWVPRKAKHSYVEAIVTHRRRELANNFDHMIVWDRLTDRPLISS